MYVYIYIHTQNPTLTVCITYQVTKRGFPIGKEEIVTLSCHVIKKGARTNPVLLSHRKNGSNPFGQPKMKLPSITNPP